MRTPAELEPIARRAIEETLAELPPEILKALEAIPIFLDDVPDREDVESGLDPDLLGLFDPGLEQTARIRLWLGNLWSYSDCREHLFVEEVKITLLHEIGHALGWDEEDLESRGLG